MRFRFRCDCSGVNTLRRLTAEWSLSSTSAPAHGTEPWVEATRPRSESELQAEFIARNAIFQISPQCGTLAPGEGCTVRVSFSGKALGRLQMPAQLLVERGRRLRLDLSGMCTAPDAQTVLLPGAPEPNAVGSLQLKPVAIGEAHPPLQMWSFRNVGTAAMHWALDTAPLAALAGEHCGCVTTCKLRLLACEINSSRLGHAACLAASSHSVPGRQSYFGPSTGTK